MAVLRRHGVAENSAGRPAVAVAQLRAALGLLDGAAEPAAEVGPLAGDRARTGGADAASPTGDVGRLRFRVLLSLAVAEFELGGLTAADPVLDAAAVLARSLPDDRLLPQWHCQRALVRGRSGDRAGARADLDAALTRPDAFTPAERCSTLLNLGMLWAEDDGARRAVELFREAGELAETHGLARQLFMARHNEGYAAYRVGDLPRALALMDLAEEVGADVSRAPALLDHARVLLEAGLLREADDLLDRAVAIGADRTQSQVVGEALLERARGRLLLTDHDTAADLAGQARAHFRERRAPALEDRARLALLDVHLARGEASRTVLEEAGRLALEASRRGDDDLAAQAHLVGAEAALAVDDEGAAGAHIRLLPVTPPTQLRSTLRLAYVRGRAAVAAGDPAGARRTVRAAARDLARGQAASASLDLRAARALHGVRLARLDLDLAMPRGVREVLSALERWHAATSRLPAVRPPLDAETAALYERLRYLRDRRREHPDAEAAERWRHDADRIERRIRFRDWTHGDAAGPGTARSRPLGDGLPPPGRISTAALHGARDALAEHGRDLLWFFPHAGALWALTLWVGRGSLHRVAELGAAEELTRRVHADLRAAARHDLGGLAAAVRGSLDAGLERADAELVRPCGLGDRPLVLVPCRAVASLPWAMLPSLRGVPLTLAPSLTAYTTRTSATPSRPPGPGGPPRAAVAVGPRLGRAREEGDAVARTWRARGVEVTRTSTGAGLVDALTRPGLVHVAAHGRHEPDSPLFSTLLLDDGVLFAHELQPRGIAAETVVLSACDVGSATVLPGEESLGMAAAMLSLGAACVVAALSPVPDIVAADVMTRYHAALAAGQPTDEALAAAQTGADPLAGTFVATGGTRRLAAPASRGDPLTRLR